MKKNKQFLIIFLVVFLIGIVSAEVNDYAPVKQYDCITIKQTCSTCSYVNVSVSYPNSTLAVINEDMSNEGGGLWTYEFCGTNYLGRYDISGKGDLDGTDTSFNVLYFEVTTTGVSQKSFWNYPLIFILALLGLGLVIFGASQGIPWFGFIGSIMFLLLGIYIMIYGLENVADFYTRGIAITSLGMGFIFMFASAYEWIWGRDSGSIGDED